MNLTDLQIELRSIEEHIANLHSEIEKMKPQTKEEKKADFERVTKLAEKNPIGKKSIQGAPVEIKKLIFSSLSYILLLEEEDFYSRILYLCRLAKGCGFNTSAENLYKLGLEFEMNDLNKLCQDISDYKYTYLVETLIMTNISEEASVRILSIVTDIASAFEISKEEMRVLGMTAKGVLIGNIDCILGMPIPSKNIWGGKLKDYLSKEWIEQHRIDCGLLCTKKYNQRSIFGVPVSVSYGQSSINYTEDTPCEMIKRTQTGTIVKKGEILCIYSEKVIKKKENRNDAGFAASFRTMETLNPEYETVEKIITAPSDGIVFFINAKKNGAVKDKPDEYIAIYIVSYFDDYSEFSAWHKGKFCSGKK